MGQATRALLLQQTRAERTFEVSAEGHATLEFTIRELSGADRDEFEGFVQHATKTNNWRGIRAKLFQLSVVEHGQPMFEPSELAQIGELPGSIVDAVWKESTEFNRLEETADDAEKK